MIEFKVSVFKVLNMLQYHGLDPDPKLDPDPELKKFKAGSGSGISHSGFATLLTSDNLGNRPYMCDRRKCHKKFLKMAEIGKKGS